MPIKKCKSNKKSGYKYGSSGKCYIGKSGRSKAIKQMRAIKANEK